MTNHPRIPRTPASPPRPLPPKLPPLLPCLLHFVLQVVLHVVLHVVPLRSGSEQTLWNQPTNERGGEPKEFWTLEREGGADGASAAETQRERGEARETRRPEGPKARGERPRSPRLGPPGQARAVAGPLGRRFESSLSLARCRSLSLSHCVRGRTCTHLQGRSRAAIGCWFARAIQSWPARTALSGAVSFWPRGHVCCCIWPNGWRERPRMERTESRVVPKFCPRQCRGGALALYYTRQQARLRSLRPGACPEYQTHVTRGVTTSVTRGRGCVTAWPRPGGANA